MQRIYPLIGEGAIGVRKLNCYAAANLSQWNSAPPIVTAMAVPKTTGMVDAVSE